MELCKRIAADLENLSGFAQWWASVARGARFELVQGAHAPCAYSVGLLDRGNFAQATWLGSWGNLPDLCLGPMLVDATRGPLVLRLRDGNGRCTELLDFGLDWTAICKRKGKTLKIRQADIASDLVLARVGDGVFQLLPAAAYLSP